MFVDTAKVFITAGKGGNGAVSFRHEIYVLTAVMVVVVVMLYLLRPTTSIHCLIFATNPNSKLSQVKTVASRIVKENLAKACM
jgi:hypothetical protein